MSKFDRVLFDAIMFELDGLKRSIYDLSKRVILLEEMYELLHRELLE